MKNGNRLPTCPIRVEYKEFPTQLEKAEEFVSVHAKNSSLEGLSPVKRNFRITEECSETYNDPTPINDISINSPITFKEVKDAIGYLGKRKQYSNCIYCTIFKLHNSILNSNFTYRPTVFKLLIIYYIQSTRGV